MKDNELKIRREGHAMYVIAAKLFFLDFFPKTIPWLVKLIGVWRYILCMRYKTKNRLKIFTLKKVYIQ